MTLRTFSDIEQGTPEWLELRRGIVTASYVGRLLTGGGAVSKSRTADNAMLTLAAERLTGRIERIPTTRDMERGTWNEPFARNLYTAHFSVQVDEIGFMTEDRWGFTLGYSPDGLVGDDGLIEIKSRRQQRQVATILDGKVPAENMAQIQCGLLVSGRSWCDYVSFSEGCPLFVTRVPPDEHWQASILTATQQFEHLFLTIEEHITAATNGMPTCPDTGFDTDDTITID
ncbi:putative phage-type endonuclease [Acidipropionibacterium jensenii]|uniref:Putative phage-type endonuclease n=1 Tax=Acidipropionibacterium jensenii TaxID=1749 RepID=A0A448P1T4_9ACTN|nr:lambda exonuclease family protein [Acidipropionibacterium jensenii]VEI04146.1 putative phage-type endonuclease [Acidipropionibacterium jensenii]